MSKRFYGRLTVDEHTRLKANGVHLRVFYKGVDVTDNCMYADDEACAVVLVCRDSERHTDWSLTDGWVHINAARGLDGMPCKFEFVGDMEIRPAL